MFISYAYAQGAAAASGPQSLLSLWPFLLMFAVMYFVMLRPQMKRQKEQRTMLEALAKNDEVITSGGVVGKVVKVTEAFVTIEISEGVKMHVQKASVTTIIPTGTLKTL